MGLYDNVPSDFKNGNIKSNKNMDLKVPEWLAKTNAYKLVTGREMKDGLPSDYISTKELTPFSEDGLFMRGNSNTITPTVNNNLYGFNNNGVLGVNPARNPLSATSSPVNIDTVAKAPIGAGNTPTQSSTPAPTLYASNQASNASGVPTVQNATFQSPTNEMTNPMDMSMSDAYNKASFDADPRTGLYSQGTSMNGSVASTPYSFMDNFTDFSSKDAAKNSLGNIATGVNVAGGLFDAYNKYQTQKAQADYQNRIASLYEKQYNDTEARRANAQANYDASVPK
jgi:hypothetical protein